MAQIVAYFHPRKNEFRQYWNRHLWMKKKQKDVGVANPVILTIELKE